MICFVLDWSHCNQTLTSSFDCTAIEATTLADTMTEKSSNNRSHGVFMKIGDGESPLNQQPFTSFLVHNTLRCGSYCLRNKNCWSFTIETTTQTCALYSSIHYSNMEQKSNVNYFKIMLGKNGKTNFVDSGQSSESYSAE